MRGIRFSNLLATPFVLGALFVLYQIFFLEKENWIYYLIPFLLIILLLYLTSNDLNFWYHRKFPPKLDPAIVNWLSNFFPYYNQLENDNLQKFETRLALYLEGRAFKLVLMKEQKNIPEDFKAIIAAHAIQMSMNLDNFLLEPYERIFVYNHPFPSPAHQFLHTVEVEKEDKVILLSLEQLMLALGKPTEFYNIAFHAYAEVLLDLIPELASIDVTWEDLERVFGRPTDSILKLTGYENLSLKAVAVVLFFSHSEDFEQQLPTQFAEIKAHLSNEH